MRGISTIVSALTGITTLLLAGGAPADSWHSSSRMYAVTITNLTSGQVLTPPIVAIHKHGFRLFQPGDVAGEPLYIMAETGNPMPLAEHLRDEDAVTDVAVADGPIMPGQSLTVHVEAGWRAQFSVFGMLASTNDAFFALQGERVTRWGSADAIAYDAGSEANNELCEFLPGPPCSGSKARMTDGAEGFIHVANGIHGQGDLAPEVRDWRGPVARIQVHRRR